MSETRFAIAQETLDGLVEDALSLAKAKGATDAETEASEGYGQSVSVRKGKVENIEYNRDKGLGITVYVGQKKGHASTSDLSRKAISDAVDAALSIARFTADDEAAGLADEDLLCHNAPDLDLFHPWDLPVEEGIEIAKACEAAAFRLDKRIVNSDGAGVSCQQQHFSLGNSRGFRGGYPSSRHYISCAVIAAERGAMQRDDWYVTCRSREELAEPEAVGAYAGRRALARLRSRKLDTRQSPVLFEAPIASSLLAHFVSAVSGGSLYRKSSFLVDSLGKEIFSPIVNLSELPHIARGQASGWFDDDGVVTRDRDVVRDGIVEGYFLGSYSARKLGMRTTGNAGGNHNLVLRPGDEDLDELLVRMGSGLLVTELMGQGINMVTGDYSRGAAGFWVEDGVIAYPVEEITIAGNLRDMFRSIVAIGDDVLVRGSRSTGSILIERMTIAGS